MATRNKASRLINILSILFLVTPFVSYSQNVDSLLVVLEETMSKRTEYDLSKETRINNLKKLFEDSTTSLENQYYITNKLIDEYEYYSFDSTLNFIEKNLKLANELENNFLIQESTLRLAKILTTSGRYDESIDLRERIEPSNLSQDVIWEYYFIYKRCYAELRNISRVARIREKYNELHLAFKDSLNTEISNFDKNSFPYLDITEQNYRDANEFRKALEINTTRLLIAKPGTREFAMAAFNKSFMSIELDGDKYVQKKFLILSAISDIQSSTKDNASLANLAAILFEQGDIERAHKYISFSYEDAKFYNSKLRYLDLSNVLPLISNSYEKLNLKQSNKLKKQLIFISVLSLVLLVALFLIYKQYKKIKLGREHLKTANLKLNDLNEKLSYTNKDLKRLYEELSEVDTIKEHYIGTFLNLYSEYINKLDSYIKTVRKYIVTNKVNELLELTKSKQVIDEEIKIFYKNFDESFLHIYPNFVKQVNSLLKPDKQITLEDDEQLNTELRILALIRLGINNSSKISKILKYSVNTIYNYRVKLKNSSVDREKFEDMVKMIS